MHRSAIYLLPASLLASLVTALQLPDIRPFTSAIADIFHEALPHSFDNATQHELLKRQYSNTCPDQYDSCANLGAPNLCCISNAVCSADQAGMVACCPSGAVCTGSITGYIQSGTVDSNGILIGGGGGGGGGGAATTTGTGGLVGTTASTTSFQFYSTSSGGLVPATQPTYAGTESGTATGNGFIIAGSSTVATPAAGMRRAEIPRVISAVVYVLEYLRI